MVLCGGGGWCGRAGSNNNRKQNSREGVLPQGWERKRKSLLAGLSQMIKWSYLKYIGLNLAIFDKAKTPLQLHMWGREKRREEEEKMHLTLSCFWFAFVWMVDLNTLWLIIAEFRQVKLMLSLILLKCKGWLLAITNYQQIEPCFVGPK